LFFLSIIGKYLTATHYADHALGKFIEGLKIKNSGKIPSLLFMGITQDTTLLKLLNLSDYYLNDLPEKEENPF
jgi:hypothetical protein